MNRALKFFAMLGIICALPFPAIGMAADKSVVGTWRLLSWGSEDLETGKISNVFGE